MHWRHYSRRERCFGTCLSQSSIFFRGNNMHMQHGLFVTNTHKAWTPRYKKQQICIWFGLLIRHHHGMLMVTVLLAEAMSARTKCSTIHKLLPQSLTVCISAWDSYVIALPECSAKHLKASSNLVPTIYTRLLHHALQINQCRTHHTLWFLSPIQRNLDCHVSQKLFVIQFLCKKWQ